MNRQYQAKPGQTYWMINSRFQVCKTINDGTALARKRIKVGNCFKTKGEAQDFVKLIKDLARGCSIGTARRWWRIW